MGTVRNTIIIVAVLVLLAIVPSLVTSPYQMHLAIMACINIMLGLNFAMLYGAGLLSMAAAVFWGIGAYTSALLVVKAGLSFWIALPLSGLMAAIVALATGAVVVRTTGLGFLIQTLIMNMILPELLGHFQFFGGRAGILGIPGIGHMGPIAFVGKVPYYYLGLVILLLNVLAFRALYRSRFGRAWSSIKLNPNLAQTLGINIYWYKIAAFIISAIWVGFAGSFYAHYFQTLEPGMFIASKSMYAQVFAVLGGLGYYILGPAIGAVIMTVVPELLRVSKDIEPIMTGVVLICLVLFLPGGILSIPERSRYFASLMRRRRKPREVVTPATEG